MSDKELLEYNKKKDSICNILKKRFLYSGWAVSIFNPTTFYYDDNIKIGCQTINREELKAVAVKKGWLRKDTEINGEFIQQRKAVINRNIKVFGKSVLYYRQYRVGSKITIKNGMITDQDGIPRWEDAEYSYLYHVNALDITKIKSAFDVPDFIAGRKYEIRSDGILMSDWNVLISNPILKIIMKFFNIL